MWPHLKYSQTDFCYSSKHLLIIATKRLNKVRSDCTDTDTHGQVQEDIYDIKDFITPYTHITHSGAGQHMVSAK